MLNSSISQFVIEREIPGAGTLSEAQIRDMSMRSLQTLNDLGPHIQWLHSYVTEDKVYCIYLAPDEDTVREHARRVGFQPIGLSAVRRLIDPVNLRLAAAGSSKQYWIAFCSAHARNPFATRVSLGSPSDFQAGTRSDRV